MKSTRGRFLRCFLLVLFGTLVPLSHASGDSDKNCPKAARGLLDIKVHMPVVSAQIDPVEGTFDRLEYSFPRSDYEKLLQRLVGLLNRVDNTRIYRFQATPDGLEVTIIPKEAVPVEERNLLPSSAGINEPDKLKLSYPHSDYEALVQRLVDELNGVDNVHIYSFKTTFHHLTETNRLEVTGLPAEIIPGREEVLLDSVDVPEAKASTPLWDIPTPGAENDSSYSYKEVLKMEDKLIKQLNETAEGDTTYFIPREHGSDLIEAPAPESGDRMLDSGRQSLGQGSGGARRQNQTSWKSVKETSESWLREEGREIKAKAQFLMAQIGSGEGRFEHYLKLLSESDQAAVWKEIDQKTSFRFFRDLARESGIDQKVFDQTPLHTFLFENIDSTGTQTGPSVSQLQYALVMGENPSLLMQERWKVSIGDKEILVDPNLPVDNAGGDEIRQFFRKLNELQDEYTYDLPTVEDLIFMRIRNNN